jgi:hypothetical protein
MHLTLTRQKQTIPPSSFAHARSLHRTLIEEYETPSLHASFTPDPMRSIITSRTNVCAWAKGNEGKKNKSDGMREKETRRM